MPPSRRSVLALLAAVLAPRAAHAASEAPNVHLQPLGAPLPEADFALVEAALGAFFHVSVQRLPSRPLPQSAYYAPRQRYRAEKLLPFLEQQQPSESLRIIGLTAVDISTTKPPHADWGILGLAIIGGPACVVSSFRTRRGATGADHARIRFAKTVVHELGHALGLGHCKEPGCLMQDGQGTVTTTDRGYDFCHGCRLMLLKRGVPLADADVPVPWPRPA